VTRAFGAQSQNPRRKLAIILSGGGARGAYEVGVLSYVFERIAKLRGAPPKISILSGTSVGAINACFLAAHMTEPDFGMNRLVRLWTELDMSQVLNFGVRQAMLLPRVLTGGGGGAGIFDVRPLVKLASREVNWRSISRSLRSGHLQTLSVSATEVRSGRTVVFMQTGPDGALPTTTPPRTVIRADRIGPHHALASAAIPVLFPPVKIGHELYVDGGLRQNTPIAPALRLGATHVFAVGLSRDVRGIQAPPPGQVTAPGAAFLLGKVLNAFLLDHVQNDFELMQRLNEVLADGTRVYGPDFVEKLTAAARARGGQPYRQVSALAVHPSDDIGRLAAEHVRKGKVRGGALLTRQFLNLLDAGVGPDADLASYLLFDGSFARKLIDMGRSDAEARREELLQFFGSPSEDENIQPSSDERPSGEWTLPPPSVG